MSTATTILRTLGGIAQEAGLDYLLVRRIAHEQGIAPALIDCGMHKFDDAAFERIVRAAAERSTRQPARRVAGGGRGARGVMQC